MSEGQERKTSSGGWLCRDYKQLDERREDMESGCVHMHACVIFSKPWALQVHLQLALHSFW